MNKKNLIFAIVILAIILAIIIGVVIKTNNDQKIANQDQSLNNQTNQTNQTAVTENTPADNTASGTNTQSFGTPTAPAAIQADLGMLPGSEGGPKQEVIKAEEIPASALTLKVSDTGFIPAKFTIKAGQKVTLAVTSVGGNSHNFLFLDARLMGINTMVSAGETKTVTFTAPPAGSYSFRDDIPTFRKNTGTMIVQ